MADRISKRVREDLDKLGPEKKARVIDVANRGKSDFVQIPAANPPAPPVVRK